MKTGFWKTGNLRTFRSVAENHKNYIESKLNKSSVKHFMSCEFPPIELHSDQEDKLTLF